ncbi:MAG: CinA family protein [Bdellovibrio sp.]|nr:CinA family protein [Bdellovibrio sp.]
MKVTEEKTEIQQIENVTKAIQDLRDKGLTVGFSESCTGGLLSSYFTKHSGVSDVYMGSVISYANAVKEKILGVNHQTLVAHGAVSFETAKEMAEGALKALDVKVAVSITGIAGPNGGSAAKPVGTVFIAVGGMKSEVGVPTMLGTETFEYHFQGDRQQIQFLACVEATNNLTKFIKKNY